MKTPAQAARWLARRGAPGAKLTFPLGECGRLGNQLHQIAATIGIAWDLSSQAVFSRHWPYRRFYSLPDALFGNAFMVARSRDSWKLAVGIDETIRAYLQEPALWRPYRETIQSWLQPSTLALEAVSARHRKLLDLPSKAAIHVRRGDYVASTNHVVLPLSYYEQAAEIVIAADPSTAFLVFSDDIDWCRRNLRIPGVYFVEGNPDWLDMALMSRCDHHICANSTFSWWGAFLSSDPSPIVPRPWPVEMLQPEGWLELPVEG
ncbi:MAG TPA: alpha-1,2-fucosyltransferase [Gaiellaceae bacterium]|nr:alpha-1,2-fucosyltransferase [Gaiellaceae bacterium]